MDTLADTKSVDIITPLRAIVQTDAERGLTEPQPDIVELLKQRRFQAGIQPPPLRPIYCLAGQVIATPGNLATITAGVKAGKTGVIGAMMASAMTENKDADLLGFSSSNPKSYALLHFDLEQSPYDHWHQIARALKRAGLQKSPPWLWSYCLTGLGPKLAWKCVSEATRRAAELHGGTHSLLIDGAADLVTDVNDAAESNEFVAMLHDMAIKGDCSILGVIHFNPDSTKVRGHLGSQLERKAETNLRLDKSHEVTTIWSNKQRRAPIPKGTGPCFQWSDEAEMHVSIETRQTIMDKEEVERLTLLAEKVFGEHSSMRHSELVSTVSAQEKKDKRTAERRISRMTTLKIIKKSEAGLYARAA